MRDCCIAKGYRRSTGTRSSSLDVEENLATRTARHGETPDGDMIQRHPLRLVRMPWAPFQRQERQDVQDVAMPMTDVWPGNVQQCKHRRQEATELAM